MVMEPQKIIRLQQTRSQHQRKPLLFTCGRGIDVWGKSQRDFPTVAFRGFYKGSRRCVLGEPAGFLPSSLSNVSLFISQAQLPPGDKQRTAMPAACSPYSQGGRGWPDGSPGSKRADGRSSRSHSSTLQFHTKPTRERQTITCPLSEGLH